MATTSPSAPSTANAAHRGSGGDDGGLESSERPVVWIVDDNPRDAERARRAIASTCRVEVLSDGSAAIERLATRDPPDLLVLDWVMPGITGIEVLRFVRSEPSAQHDIPVLMLTVFRSPQQIVECLAVGANDFVAKPFEDLEFRARVEALIRTSRLLQRATQAEETVRRLLASAPDALLTVDATGRISFANAEACRIFERPAEHLVGEPLRALAPELVLRNISVAPGVPLLPLPDVRIGGKVYAPSIRTLPGDDAANTSISLRDVTERRRIEQRRLDFYSVIAHDLRSPLTAMSTRIDLLLRGRRGPLSTQLVDDLHSFQRQTRSMVAMINDFLDLARLEGTGYKIAREEVEVCRATEEVLEQLRPLADASQLDLRLETCGEAYILGDGPRLAQVLANLVGNAVKFTPPGGRVGVEVRQEDGQVEVRVSDSGPGIPEEQQATLFERFARAPGASDTGGTGLGLMIVREVIEAHGGRVGVESRVGEGSTFWFRLPLLRPSRQEVRFDEMRGEHAGA